MTPATRPPRVHPAWIVLAAISLALMSAAGLRAVFGVYIKPMESEFGWTRSVLSVAAAMSLLVLGAVAPFAGRLADRWGARLVIVVSVALLGVGTIASGLVQGLTHVYVAALLVAVGAGGAAMATGSTVIARWFEARRGLAMGVMGGAMSAGHLVVIPLATGLMLALGWRTSFVLIGASVFVLVLPLALALIRNDPEAAGLRPYGAAGPAQSSAEVAALQRAGRVSISDAVQVPQFWLLMATFFVCGYTSMGTVGVHFIPHALDHSFTELQASAALGVMGAMNVIGTVASGWICDRIGRRGPLATYYFLRGLSLIFLLYVWDLPSLHLWAAIFGLNYISTVPPTTTLTANIFGRYSVGELSGWIFFAHQVGSALGAALSGWIYEWTGSYTGAFMSAAVLAIAAAALALMIREEPVTRHPTAAAAPVAA